MERGGQPSLEIKHAKLLLDTGAEDVWGWNTPAGRERVKARVQWLIDACGIKEGVRVLECGCGTGVFTRHLASTGADVTAMDISAELLNVARRDCTKKNITFVQGNLEEPEDYPSGFYDVLCGVSVLHHLNLPKALNAMKKKLKPSARFAFSEPNLLNPINRYIIFTKNQDKRLKNGVSPTEMAFHREELFRLFKESRFEVRALNYRDFMHPSMPSTLIPIAKKIQFIAERTPIIRRWSGSLWVSGVI